MKGDKNMFLGKWDSSVDEKWRLVIPITIKGVGSHVFLKEGNNNGCIQIYESLLLPAEEEDLSSIFPVKLRVSSGGLRRISIPEALRGSISFYFGKKVMIAGKGDYLEIWPRP